MSVVHLGASKVSHIPHPQNDPLVRRPARERPGERMDDEAERNRTSRSEPGSQGSGTPGLREAPPPELAVDQLHRSEGKTHELETPSQNLRQVLLEAEIESGGPMTDEARRQLEQNIVRQDNYP